MKHHSWSLVAMKGIVSLLGVGFLRPASATLGSLAAGLLLYPFWPTLSSTTKLQAILIIFIIGWFFSQKIEQAEHLHDPHFIVIDEALGMMMSTFFLGQIWWQWLIAFLLFRFFDIAKFWPASWFDQRKGGFSIMFDDVLMAIPVIAIGFFL